VKNKRVRDGFSGNLAKLRYLMVKRNPEAVQA
jgi:hypothetical protein